MTPPRLLALLLAVGACSLSAACGPSFQAIYEGDARFEHCYALEDTPNAPMRDRTACWRDWSQNYTYGQTRDRVEYAAARSRALSRVHGAPTDEAMMQAAPGEGSEYHGVAAPAPTSAFAPPPKTLGEVDAGARTFIKIPDVLPPTPQPAVSSIVSAPLAPPPGADCSDECSRGWQSCSGSCDKAKGDCEKCQKTYKTCMKGCFKAVAPTRSTWASSGSR